MRCTSVFYKNVDAWLAAKNEGRKFIVNQGGARSSKTFSILQLLLLIAIKNQGNKAKKISVISESVPHLLKGSISDFEKILKAEGVYSSSYIYQAQHIYKIGDSIIEFFSAEDEGKVTGPSREIVYFNECNNIPYKIFDAAIVRSSDAVFVDYNPTHEFYIHEKILQERSDECTFIKSTYKDNEFLHPNLVREIESRRDKDENWWKVFGLGELGSLEGLIFPEVILIDEMPLSDKRIHGMDFGFTNDPTTLADIRVIGEDMFLDELLYQTAMTSGDIIRFLKSIEFGKKELVADSSDPKTIAELRRGGFNVHEAVKGPDSIKFGIDLIKTKRIHITKRSVNFIKEQRNYKWKTDRSTGKPLNEPIDFFNHLWDPTRYGLTKLITKPKVFGVKAN